MVGWSAHWCITYLKSPWNCFNLIIIILSFWSAVYPNAPAFHAIRAVRVLRATKLLAYFGKLREIVAATLASIVPVASSFVILGLVTCIYATMGVTFFGEDPSNLFEDFSTALFTMFQVCTGDAWASEVARVMVEADGRMMAGSTVFFVSYVLIAWCVLLNIVVAAAAFQTKLTKPNYCCRCVLLNIVVAAAAF